MDKINFKHNFENIVGECAGMQEVYKNIKNYAPRKINVLITGETGTGKELVANAIHENSHRKEKPFIFINCSSIAETLSESEMFGHEKGSFTGATKSKIGVFERADGGTLVLDEISEMSLSLQAKILRVIEYGDFLKVGSEQPSKVDIRLIAISNRDLAKEVITGKFRKDLFFRLCVARINLPPLQNRENDIVFLLYHFLDLFNKKCKKQLNKISPEALGLLKKYTWPGNCRELKNFSEFAVCTIDEDIILPEHLKEFFDKNTLNMDIHTEAEEDELMKKFILKNDNGLLAKMERKLIKQLLTITKNNRTHSAEKLGVSLNTLKSKIKNYEIDVE